MFKTRIVIKKEINSLSKLIKRIKKRIFFLIDRKFFKRWKYYLGKEDIKMKNMLLIKGGDESKNVYLVIYIIHKLIGKLIRKEDVIFAIGGGVVGDISGLISLITLRGIKLINVPTTILSQVDSSIGGKNGVNCLFGKNLIGGIKQSDYVLVILDFIKTLDFNEYINGLGEVIKIAIINNPKLFKIIESHIKEIKKREGNIVKYIVKESIKGKLLILSKGIEDKGYRLKLNLGHTIGHALEKESGYVIKHGNAIIIGIRKICLLSNIYFNLNNSLYLRINYLINKLFGNKGKELIKLYGSKITRNIMFDKKIKDKYVILVIIKNIGKISLIKVKKENIGKLILKI